MPRYIDSDALRADWLENGENEYVYDTNTFLDSIDNAPTVDVAPVRHGQWERIGIRGRKGLTIYPCCSACGMVSAAYRSEWEGLRGAWNFCPNCGAIMDADTQAREGV